MCDFQLTETFLLHHFIGRQMGEINEEIIDKNIPLARPNKSHYNLFKLIF